MTFPVKIFHNNVDDDIHKALVRFSKGAFENHALSSVKVSKTNFKLKCSYDLIKDILKLICAQANDLSISGILFKSRKKTHVNEKVKSTDFLAMLDENDFVLVDVEANGISLKCKKAVPKIGRA